MTVKDYVEIVSDLFSPLTAIVAAYIAWRQYQISFSSLYERRLKVFMAFMSYLADIMREGKTSYQRVTQFYAEASEAEFLFKGKILNKLEELYKNGIRLVTLHEKLYPSDGSPGLPVGEERSRVAKEESDLLRWFVEQTKETKELFKKQMKVS